MLDGHPGVDELEEQHAFPEWTDRAMFIGFLTVAVLTGLAQVESQWLFWGLLALAVLPSAIDCVRPIAERDVRRDGPRPPGDHQLGTRVGRAAGPPARPLAGQPADGHAPGRTDRGDRVTTGHGPGGRRLLRAAGRSVVRRRPVRRLPHLDGGGGHRRDDRSRDAPPDRIDGRPQGGRGRPRREGRHRRAAAHRPRGPRRDRPLDDRHHAPRHRGPPGRRERRRRCRDRGAAGSGEGGPGEPERDPPHRRAAPHGARRWHRGAPAQRRRHRAARRRVRGGGCRRAPGRRWRPRRGEPTRGADAVPGGAGVARQRGAAPARLVDRGERHRRGRRPRARAVRGREAPTGQRLHPGNGIQGMRERVEALHGSLSAGPAGRSAWLVECHLPEASS